MGLPVNVRFLYHKQPDFFVFPAVFYFKGGLKKILKSILKKTLMK